MATLETQVREQAPATDKEKPAPASHESSVIDRVLRLLSSVRFGIIMLVLLLVCCMIGMLVMQQNVQGFRQYYQGLAPSQRALYASLGLFDIYHAWYFTLLLAITALNIILSSIDRFPTAWQYIRKPRLLASPKFISAQMFNVATEVKGAPDAAAKRIAEAWRRNGLRPRTSQEGERVTVFAQRNVWNRLGAYAVHVGLLTILVGGFLTSRYGLGGSLEIAPGETSQSFVSAEAQLDGERVNRVQLPFEVECTDLQQELIRPEGGLDVMNTIDWLSFIRIKDSGREINALVHLNSPYDYRGYRFFQSSFQAVGSARRINVGFEPEVGGPAREVVIERGGSVDVEGIGRVTYANFYPDLLIDHSQPITVSGDYNNPAAELKITSPNGATSTVLALDPKARIESSHGEVENKNLSVEAGVRAVMTGYEKVAQSHTLTVQYDPGRLPVYFGFALLTVSLCAVFFFSHQRIWAVVEPEGKRSRAYFGGNTNRNRPAFETEFSSLVSAASEKGESNE